jgi:hypothetical protein
MGEFAEGKRYGLGLMIYNTQRVYEGQWINDFREGNGYE